MFGIPNPYVFAAGGLVAVGVIVGAFEFGRHVEHQANDIAALKTRVAVQTLDRKIDKGARDEAADGAAILRIASDKNREIVNGPLPKPKPTRACADARNATPADIEWLRRIQ